MGGATALAEETVRDARSLRASVRAGQGHSDRHGSPGASESRKEKEAEQQQARAFQECPPEGTGKGEVGSPDERVEGAVRKGCLQEGVRAAGTHHSQVSQESFCSSQE